MSILSVTHRTEYHYHQPVVLGQHRLMSRPRDSHDLRLLDTGLTITPTPSRLRWLHDVFGNSIAIVDFDAPTADLVFESTFRAEHYPLPQQTIVVDEYAARIPFSYSASEAVDLAAYRSRQYPDAGHRLDAWVNATLDSVPGFGTFDVLIAINAAIRQGFAYRRREEMGVQTPVATLELRSGSCRDFAVFMLDAVRCLGFAAQFVSGYLYDVELVGAAAREDFLNRSCARHAVADDNKFLLAHDYCFLNFHDAKIDHHGALQAFRRQDHQV